LPAGNTGQENAMGPAVQALRTSARGIWRVISFVRDGEADIRGTYPDEPPMDPTQVVVTTSINIAAMNVGINV
jgi:hypothetical protein